LLGPIAADAQIGDRHRKQAFQRGRIGRVVRDLVAMRVGIARHKNDGVRGL
jgi:hypothetical protein